MAGLFLLSLSHAAIAKTPVSYSSALSVYARNGDHQFTEYLEDDVVINQEQGEMEHLGIALHWQFDSGVFMEVAAERGTGTIAYQGYTQSLQEVRELRSEYLLTDQHLHLGRDFGNHSAYIGIGSRYRERNIIEGNLYEELDWRYAAFGLAKQFRLGQRWQINFSGELAMALDAQLRAEFAGTFDPVTVVPGQLLTGHGGAEVVFAFTPKFSVGVGPRYEFTRIKKGENYPLSQDGREIAVAHQPKSEYESIFWQLRLNKLF